MTWLVWLMLALTAAFAAGDWVAVAHRRKRLEYICKPATMAALAGVALALDPESPAQRWWFLAALAFGLAGDIFLMLPRDLFAAGLGAFLVGHLAYIGGFFVRGVSPVALALAVVIVAVPAGLVLRRVLAGIRASAPALAVPVVLYAAVIMLMVGSAAGSLSILAIAGSVLFITSDGTIAINRFVAQRPWMPVAIIVTYHAGQALLVLSLAR